jgi:hypothetical protein
MADILQEFTVKASPDNVFWMFSTPEGLDRWWTKSSAGIAKEGAECKLFFGPGYDWRATRVGCELERDGWVGHSRALLSHWLATAERPLARLLLLLGHVPAALAALGRARRVRPLREAPRSLALQVDSSR